MKRLASLLCLIILGTIYMCSQPQNRPVSKGGASSREFGPALKRMAKEWSIPGVSVAVIKNGEIEFNAGFGIKNATTGEPVDENTIFDAASLTKPLFAYFVMLMANKGVIQLDAPIVKYMSRQRWDAYFKRFGYSMDQAGFRNDWFAMMTPRHVLSHSAGLPHGEIYEGKKPEVYPLFSEPGTRFKYSAEGYFILQGVLEEILDERLDTLMANYVFKPLEMDNSYMVWDDRIADLAAYGHSIIGLPSESLRKAQTPHAGGSLYTTANDYAKFLAAVLNGSSLSEKSRRDMFQPVVKIEANLFYAPGFALEESSNGLCLWHTGDWGPFRNFAMADIRTKSAVVYLTNSWYGLSIYPRVIEMVFEGDHPLARCDFLKYYRGLGNSRRVLDNIDEAIRYFSSAAFKGNQDFAAIEIHLNFMAYEYMRAKKYAEAIKLCRYNTTAFPESGNAWDSLGEAYMLNGLNDLAINAFEKSLECNPNNSKASERLAKLKDKSDS